MSNVNRGIKSLIPELLKASAGNDVEKLKVLLEQARYQGQWEPKLLRSALQKAAEKDDPENLQYLLGEARSEGVLDENILRIALQKAAEKGRESAARLLLRAGADTEVEQNSKALTPLYRAVERNKTSMVRILLENGARTTATDSYGRATLATAVWWNHIDIVRLLLEHGANPNGEDQDERTVLHNLALDKQCRWKDEVVLLILDTSINIDATDKHGRTALQYAAITGKEDFARLLLSRRRGAKADVRKGNARGKTACHLAAESGQAKMVKLLLEAGADVNAKSDGGWTALHNASNFSKEQHPNPEPFVETVRVLLAAGADINAVTSSGMSALHWAAHHGHTEIVKSIISRKDAKRNRKDAFDSTPLLRAAQNYHHDIIELLAPWNQVDALSHDALYACNHFEATIVDFFDPGTAEHQNLVKKRTIFELLYGYDAANDKQLVTTLVKNIKPKQPAFRWIHLPANNMAWVETLITKSFIEDGSVDVEGFKALEKCFSQQHRGPKIHSHFMRPLCQRTHRSTRGPAHVQRDPALTSTGCFDGNYPNNKPSQTLSTPETAPSAKAPGDAAIRGARPDKKEKPGMQTSKPGMPENTKNKQKPSSKPARTRKPASQTGNSSAVPSNRRDAALPGSKGNIALFMPFLHYETHERRCQMTQAIRDARSGDFGKARTNDEMLIRAYLHSSTALHVRRTLDQFYYHGIDTESRDADQVVYRYCRDRRKEEKLFMVDQLWLWVLGKDLVVTTFPQRWQQPKNDPLNVLDNIIEDMNSKTKPPVRTAHDLAMLITSRCSGAFDRHNMNEDYQFLDMFESSIGEVTDKETARFSQFNEASAAASEWLKIHRAPSRFFTGDRLVDQHDRDPPFIDKLLDIGEETKLLAEIKDIRDELSMIKMVLSHQTSLLEDLPEVVIEDIREGIYFSPKSDPHFQKEREVRKRFKEQQKVVDVSIKDLERMDNQAAQIGTSILHLLDLKQKHANAFEARFARDQAAGTARQGQTIMVFTIVTIVFLPMSFMAAFFAINITEFPGDRNSGLSLSFVSSYVFGVGLAISIPMIAIAFSFDHIGGLLRSMHRKIMTFGQKKPTVIEPPSQIAGAYGGFEKSGTIASSFKRSMETTDRQSLYLSPPEPLNHNVSASPARSRKAGGRVSYSMDVERGRAASPFVDDNVRYH